MINRKGFSLVELLAVIVIIAILSVAAVPAVITISRNNKNNMFCKKVQTIEKAAQLYGSDMFEDIDEDMMLDDNVKCNMKEDNKAAAIKTHCQVTLVSTLAEQGYVNYEQAGKTKVANEVIDPRSNTSMLDYRVIVFTVNKRIHAQYVYGSIKDALKCSDVIKVGNARVRELYFQDGSFVRKVNCESNKLSTCEAMMH